MRTLLTLFITLALTAALTACTVPQRFQVGEGSGWGSKTVEWKEPPATLVAVDGTLCTVTAAKYNRVKTGDRVTCHWRGRANGPLLGDRPPLGDGPPGGSRTAPGR